VDLFLKLKKEEHTSCCTAKNAQKIFHLFNQFHLLASVFLSFFVRTGETLAVGCINNYLQCLDTGSIPDHQEHDLFCPCVDNSPVGRGYPIV
jgi:hypothetical protein